MGILSEMAMWRLVAVVAALALAVQAAPIEFGEARVDCAKAERANSVVCEAYGSDSAPCLAARDHLIGTAQCGNELGDGPEKHEEAKKKPAPKPAEHHDEHNAPAKPAAKPSYSSGAAKPKAAPKDGLKAFLAPVLETCSHMYRKSRATCKVKVALAYRAFKSGAKAQAPAFTSGSAKKPAFSSGAHETAEELADSVFTSNPGDFVELA